MTRTSSRSAVAPSRFVEESDASPAKKGKTTPVAASPKKPKHQPAESAQAPASPARLGNNEAGGADGNAALVQAQAQAIQLLELQGKSLTETRAELESVKQQCQTVTANYEKVVGDLEAEKKENKKLLAANAELAKENGALCQKLENVKEQSVIKDAQLTTLRENLVVEKAAAFAAQMSCLPSMGAAQAVGQPKQRRHDEQDEEEEEEEEEEGEEEEEEKPQRGKVPEHLKTKPVLAEQICGTLDFESCDFLRKANIKNRDDLMVRIWQKKLEKNEQATRTQKSAYNQKTQAGNEAKCCLQLLSLKKAPWAETLNERGEIIVDLDLFFKEMFKPMYKSHAGGTLRRWWLCKLLYPQFMETGQWKVRKDCGESWNNVGKYATAAKYLLSIFEDWDKEKEQITDAQKKLWWDQDFKQVKKGPKKKKKQEEEEADDDEAVPPKKRKKAAKAKPKVVDDDHSDDDDDESAGVGPEDDERSS